MLILHKMLRHRLQQLQVHRHRTLIKPCLQRLLDQHAHRLHQLRNPGTFIINVPSIKYRLIFCIQLYHPSLPPVFLSSRYPNATVSLPPRIRSPFRAHARLRLAAPALRASALISLHLARYRVPLRCPFHLPCTSLATSCGKKRHFQVKIHDSLPTTHLRPTYYPSTTYGATGTGPCHGEGIFYLNEVQAGHFN